jgi:hypothetical protein
MVTIRGFGAVTGCNANSCEISQNFNLKEFCPEGEEEGGQRALNETCEFL